VETIGQFEQAVLVALIRLGKDAYGRAILNEVQERLARDGIEPVGNTPEAFAAQIKADLERWAQVVRAAGIKPE